MSKVSLNYIMEMLRIVMFDLTYSNYIAHEYAKTCTNDIGNIFFLLQSINNKYIINLNNIKEIRPKNDISFFSRISTSGSIIYKTYISDVITRIHKGRFIALNQYDDWNPSIVSVEIIDKISKVIDIDFDYFQELFKKDKHTFKDKYEIIQILNNIPYTKMYEPTLSRDVLYLLQYVFKDNKKFKMSFYEFLNSNNNSVYFQSPSYINMFGETKEYTKKLYIRRKNDFEKNPTLLEKLMSEYKIYIPFLSKDS